MNGFQFQYVIAGTSVKLLCYRWLTNASSTTVVGWVESIIYIYRQSIN